MRKMLREDERPNFPIVRAFSQLFQGPRCILLCKGKYFYRNEAKAAFFLVYFCLAARFAYLTITFCPSTM